MNTALSSATGWDLLPAGMRDYIGVLPTVASTPVLETTSVPVVQAGAVGASGATTGPTLSAEQQRLLDVVAAGRDAIVDATVGSGKTTAIQALCAAAGDRDVLYLTYSKLLKQDAQRRVGNARVQNYHGVVYPYLKKAGIRCGVSESIRAFNAAFPSLSAGFPAYDLLVIDEYQDIVEEYAQLLRNIKSRNPAMQIVMVGDMAQKVKSNTNLDVPAFVRELCNDPVHVPFTQSFRIGEQLGHQLAQAWNKPVVGVNPQQRVRVMDQYEAVQFMSTLPAGDVLCLGKRNGPMIHALNELETNHSGTFNKHSVFASIRDGDSNVSYGNDTAVFTTYDASKGLERPVAVVYDYEPKYWDMRLKFPDCDPVVLRNIFLVAASRGKREVVFVKPDDQRATVIPVRSQRFMDPTAIGRIPVQRFVKLPAVTRPTYNRPFLASDCFDFTYAENLQACMDLLQRERLDDGSSPEIEIPRTEGLIDLSPAVGHFQEGLYFDRYDAAAVLPNSPIGQMISGELTDGDAWRNALLLAAFDTEQMRYADQVIQVIEQSAQDALIARLATRLPRNVPTQVSFQLHGCAVYSELEHSPIAFDGVVDAIHDEQIVELKFVSELSVSMFLQLALYLVMSGYQSGLLWNTRTDECWQVQVPDRERFMDAVVLCVTKQSYRTFEAE